MTNHGRCFSMYRLLLKISSTRCIVGEKQQGNENTYSLVIARVFSSLFTFYEQNEFVLEHYDKSNYKADRL